MNEIGPKSREEIQACLDTERERLLAVARSMTPVEWERESACPGWRNRDLLAHLAESERRTLEMARRASLGQQTRDPNFDLDAANAASVEAARDVPVPELIDRLALVREKTLEFFHSLPDERLHISGPHPRWGNPPASWILWHIGDHEREHREHIRRS